MTISSFSKKILLSVLLWAKNHMWNDWTLFQHGKRKLVKKSAKVTDNRMLKQQLRRRQQEGQKSNRHNRLAKQQNWTCITLFVISLPSLQNYHTKIPYFTFCGGHEHKTRLSFSFLELWHSLLEFNSRKKLSTFDKLNKMEWARWSWLKQPRIFQWRFRSCQRCCSLSFLISLPKPRFQRR